MDFNHFLRFPILALLLISLSACTPNDDNGTNNTNIDTDGDGVSDNKDDFPNDATETTDTDSDGIGDNTDPDIDNDGALNAYDAFPYDATETIDTDSDGIGDNADADIDNDGVLNAADAFPYDATETVDTDSDGVGDNNDAFPNDATETADTDSDGVGDNKDDFPNDATETIDTDSDGIGDNTDPDIDNDGALNAYDAFPYDATETIDTDSDGIGDNADADIDNDGVLNATDTFPYDPTEATDTDGDGIGDNADPDIDNDGALNAADAFPYDATETIDTDSDGIGDNTDPDIDNDGVLNAADAFPYDPTETVDTDGDGVGDNNDAFPNDATETVDTDGDGVGDNKDAFPNDATETADTDSDGIGDNADPDIDNDGALNADDAFPYDPTETADTDSDGIGDNTDPDIDNDGALNADDAFPYDPTETADTDGDGIGDNADPDNDNDGVLNADDAFPYDARETTDTDSDDFGDNAEYLLGSDPNDVLSVPHVPTWATYQGEAKHTGFMPLLLDYNDFSLRWSVTPLAGEALHPVVAADNKVYVSNNTYYSNDQSVTALNAVDGSQVWLNSYGRISSIDPPAYDNGNVYFQTGGHGDSYLRAVDAGTGSLVFRSSFSNQWSKYLAPTPYDGNIYINGGYYGGAYGFNGTSGNQLWFANLSQYDSWTPAVDLQNVYAYTGGSSSASLSVIDRTTGSVSYTIADLGYNWSGYAMNLAPVLGSNNNVLVINSGRLVNFDLQNQAIGWEQPGNYTGQPSLGLGHIYTVNSGALRVVDEITGDFVWAWEPPASDSITSNIIVAMNLVFVSDASATYAIDINTRTTVWSYPVSGKLTLSNEGALYIASQNGTLTAINISGDDDNDGMPGWWESSYGLDDSNVNDAALDADSDGLTNLEEYNNFTNPNIVDTDSDTISDSDEVNVYLTSPIQADTDGDGLDDGVEILTYLTSPLLQDTDSDGFDDNAEINQYGTDPLDDLSAPVAITSYSESFEGGSIPAGWVAAATSIADWTIDSSAAIDGTQSLRSGVITHNQNSGIEYTALFAAGTLSYSAWVNAESCCDKLEFYVDGVIVHNISANGGWNSYQTNLTSGEHTLEWRYRKDGSVNTGADAVWIDNIAFIN